MARNAIDKEQQKEDEKVRKVVEQQLHADLMILLQRPEFQRFMGWLIDFCDPMAPAFDTNGSITNYTLGQQEVGKKLYALIKKTKPEAWVTVTNSWAALKTKEKEND